MSEKHNEEFVLNTRPKGANDLKETWKLQKTTYPEIKEDGFFITKSLYVSTDPYLSSFVKKSALGGAVGGLGAVQVSAIVNEVVESKNAKFPVGAVFMGWLPWRRFNLVSEEDLPQFKILKTPDGKSTVFDHHNFSWAVGALGMPSQTAYYGAKHVGKLQAEDVLVVSGAAGAVGIILGQIAKHVIKCKKVIGIAGSEKKCEYLVKDLGFDAAVNYKEYNTVEKMAARLKELAGDPISVYFDNTGGFITEAVFEIIGRHGRIIVCGQISTYNDDEDKAHSYPNYLAKTVYRGLSILGYVVGDFFHLNEQEFFVDVPKWIDEGKIKVQETIVEGFENLPRAYEMLYTGENVGKVVVKV